MNAPANIYSVVVFDLHQKVKDFIDHLNTEGQIDLDDHGYPYIISADKTGGNMMVVFVRNGKQENFVLNTRKRADPIKSYDPLDGFRRSGGRKVITVDTGGNDGPKMERGKRPMESFERLTDQILKG